MGGATGHFVDSSGRTAVDVASVSPRLYPVVCVFCLPKPVQIFKNKFWIYLKFTAPLSRKAGGGGGWEAIVKKAKLVEFSTNQNATKFEFQYKIIVLNDCTFIGGGNSVVDTIGRAIVR